MAFENWFRMQAQEERDHAMLMYQYLQNNEKVTLKAIDKPRCALTNTMTPLNVALKHKK